MAEIKDKLVTAESLKNVYDTLNNNINQVSDKMDNLPQSDWNQNDSTQADYVKNRPFYAGDLVETELFDVCALADAVGASWVQQDGACIVRYSGDNSTIIFIDAPIVVGNEYIIEYNGTLYNFIAVDGSTIEMSDAIIIGDIDAFVSGVPTVPTLVLYPYNIMDPSDTSGRYMLFGAVVPGDTAPTELKVSGMRQEIVKIPEQYIPDKIKNTVSDVDTIKADKMDKSDPTGTGSFSLNRRADTTVGNYSFAEGNSTTASGTNSHAEGFYTTASGNHSHAEGSGTTAQRKSQHVQGEYNVLDKVSSTINRGKYAHIVGNGTSESARSNAHTLDWDGNAWYAGNVYVGSTSGTNKDEGSKKLATEEYVDSSVSGGLPLGLTGATVGQTVKIKSVDENGVPTEWEVSDINELINTTPIILSPTSDEFSSGIVTSYGFSDILTALQSGKPVYISFENAGLEGCAQIISYSRNETENGYEFTVLFGEDILKLLFTSQ